MDQLKDLFLPLTLASVSLTQLDLIIVQNRSLLFFFFFYAGVSFRGPVTKMNLRQTCSQSEERMKHVTTRLGNTVGRAARM